MRCRKKYDGPFVLDVETPYQERMLLMIPQEDGEGRD